MSESTEDSLELDAFIHWRRVKSEEGEQKKKYFINFHQDDLPAAGALSASKNKKLLSPERMLGASVASSQMLTYLELCELNDMTVLEYRDWPEVLVRHEGEGAPRVEGIFLKPRITFMEPDDEPGFRAMAIRLIRESQEKCYICAQINIKIEIKPLFIWT